MDYNVNHCYGKYETEVFECLRVISMLERVSRIDLVVVTVGPSFY